MMKKKIRIFFTLLFSLTLNASAYAASTESVIESFELENGLKVVVVPNHRIAAVNHTIWYFVGASDDPLGKSGLAHYHEHAMFLGTNNYKSGEYSNIISGNGGEHNAFTGRDATAYFINISKDNLSLAMRMEADRMRSITPSEQDIEKEKQVVLEERRMRIDNNPEYLLAEQVNASLFRHHPYRMPIIGWKHEIEKLTKQDVIDFHNKWYHPNNAMLVIGGDVTAKEIMPLVEKYYGSLPKAEIPTRNWTDEPPQNTQRLLKMYHEQVTKPQLTMNCATASLNYGNKEQAIPLYIFSQIIGGGKTSRLYKSLIKEQKLASSIYVDYSGFNRGPGGFFILSVPEHGVDIKTLEKAIKKEIEKLLKYGIKNDELKRAKTLLKADFIYARDGLSSVANFIGWIKIIGLKASYFNELPSVIDRVSEKEITEAGRIAFNDNNCVTAMLLPNDDNNGDNK
ncbi:MAG: pitrilysin family protein [Rickettsiales bacterium]